MDMISDFSFEDGDKLFEPALAAAEKIAELKKRARACRCQRDIRERQLWKVERRFRTFVERTLESSEKGRQIIREARTGTGTTCLS
jgi:hypothetical protein